MRAALLTAVLVLAACGGGAAEPVERAVGDDGLAGTTLDGERLSLAGQDGKPVFVVAFSYF